MGTFFCRENMAAGIKIVISKTKSITVIRFCCYSGVILLIVTMFTNLFQIIPFCTLRNVLLLTTFCLLHYLLKFLLLFADIGSFLSFLSNNSVGKFSELCSNSSSSSPYLYYSCIYITILTVEMS